jgi:hypothetical protein
MFFERTLMFHCKLAVIVFSALLVAASAAAQKLDDASTVAGVSLAQMCVTAPLRTRMGHESQPAATATLRMPQTCRVAREDAPPARDPRAWSPLGLPEPPAWMVWLFGVAAAAVIAVRRGRGDGFWE